MWSGGAGGLNTSLLQTSEAQFNLLIIRQLQVQQLCTETGEAAFKNSCSPQLQCSELEGSGGLITGGQAGLWSSLEPETRSLLTATKSSPLNQILLWTQILL